MADGKKTAWRWYLLIGLPIVLVVASALVYWLYPRTTYFYYGGGETWEASESSPPRLVMWKEPEALTEKVNAGPQTYEPSLGPQGLKLYFTLGLAGKNADIFVADRQGDEWVNPRPVRAVNTQYDEIGASVSPDGTRMYFYSNRPGGQGGYDLWVSESRGGSWQKPANLGPDVNSGASEYDPSVSPDGKYLLFSSNRAGKSTRGIWSVTLRERKGIKDFDIYLLELSVKPPKPHRLASLNTPANEGQPVVSPRGDFVYFASDRPGGHGGYDIWRARISDKPFKSFQTPENLGPEVNTADHEMDPTITVEGFGLYLASNREGDYEIFHVASTEVQKYAVKETLNWDMIVGKLGWPVIGLFDALLGLALLLFAMLKFRHRPGLLATSLGVSVLLHLLALFLFSLYMVQQRISELADDPSKYKLSLNLPDLEESELSESIRKKILELAMTDARKFEEKKTVKVETAEVKVAKAKPRMVHSRPDAPRREEIKFEPVTRPERTVEAEIQVATKVRMQTVDHLLMPARMLRKETRVAKTTGERVEAPKVTFRYSKIKAAPTVTPSPTMVEPKLARTVARSP
ncbi:MAG: hypothetical protein QGD94_06515, partial [Planctomycetia bacterium]|nr:hypothetical protein [Planctomycetia bacterium]